MGCPFRPLVESGCGEPGGGQGTPHWPDPRTDRGTPDLLRHNRAAYTRSRKRSAGCSRPSWMPRRSTEPRPLLLGDAGGPGPGPELADMPTVHPAGHPTRSCLRPRASRIPPVPAPTRRHGVQLRIVGLCRRRPANPPRSLPCVASLRAAWSSCSHFLSFFAPRTRVAPQPLPGLSRPAISSLTCPRGGVSKPGAAWARALRRNRYSGSSRAPGCLEKVPLDEPRHQLVEGLHAGALLHLVHRGIHGATLDPECLRALRPRTDR